MNEKVDKVENKIPDISGLVTITVLDTKIGEVESKISEISGLVKKIDYNAKISDIEEKYFTTSNYNKFVGEIIDAKIQAKGLVHKSTISNLVKNSDLNITLATLATKAELKAEQEKIVNPQAFDSSFFCGKSHFEDNGTQNYLVFQPVFRYFKKIANSHHISLWKL